MKKLTLVSIWFRGQTVSRFVMANVDENGKAIVSSQIIGSMTRQAGCLRGDTYTMG